MNIGATSRWRAGHARRSNIACRCRCQALFAMSWQLQFLGTDTRPQRTWRCLLTLFWLVMREKSLLQVEINLPLPIGTPAGSWNLNFQEAEGSQSSVQLGPQQVDAWVDFAIRFSSIAWHQTSFLWINPFELLMLWFASFTFLDYWDRGTVLVFSFCTCAWHLVKISGSRPIAQRVTSFCSQSTFCRRIKGMPGQMIW